MSLSGRIRPNIEAAPWVVEEVKRLEWELAEAYTELRKLRGTVKAIYDREVWDHAAVVQARHEGWRHNLSDGEVIMGYDREEIAQQIATEGWCPDDSSFYDEDGYQIVKTMFVSDTAIDAYIAEREKQK